MKNEREQMQEYLKQYTNANSDIQRPKSVDKAVKGVKITVVILIILTILMLIPIISFVYPLISVFFE